MPTITVLESPLFGGLCTCRHPAGTIAQADGEEVGQAIAAETNAPGRQFENVRRHGGFQTARFIILSPLPNMLNAGHTSSGGKHD